MKCNNVTLYIYYYIYTYGYKNDIYEVSSFFCYIVTSVVYYSYSFIYL